MSDWLLIALFLGLPILISAIGLFALERWHNPALDTPMTVGQLWQQILDLSFSLRKIIILALLIFPLIFFFQIFGFIPPSVIVLLFFVWLVRRMALSLPKLSDRSLEAIEALNEMAENLSQSQIHVNQLINVIKEKQLEIDEKERLFADLTSNIAEKEEEVAQWESLTQQQKDLLLQSVKKAQSRGFFTAGVAVVGSVVLNLVATLLWTLMGNPGREAIIQRVSNLIELIVPK